MGSARVLDFLIKESICASPLFRKTPTPVKANKRTRDAIATTDSFFAFVGSLDLLLISIHPFVPLSWDQARTSIVKSRESEVRETRTYIELG